MERTQTLEYLGDRFLVLLPNKVVDCVTPVLQSYLSLVCFIELHKNNLMEERGEEGGERRRRERRKGGNEKDPQNKVVDRMFYQTAYNESNRLRAMIFR